MTYGALEMQHTYIHIFSIFLPFMDGEVLKLVYLGRFINILGKQYHVLKQEMGAIILQHLDYTLQPWMHSRSTEWFVISNYHANQKQDSVAVCNSLDSGFIKL